MRRFGRILILSPMTPLVRVLAIITIAGRMSGAFGSMSIFLVSMGIAVSRGVMTMMTTVVPRCLLVVISISILLLALLVMPFLLTSCGIFLEIFQWHALH
jgi:hypothetical protein